MGGRVCRSHVRNRLHVKEENTLIMPTAVESANLILKLYELRRESTMREARNFFMMGFNPDSVEDYMAGMMGPHSGHIRMVISYW